MRARPIKELPIGWRWPTWRSYKQEKRQTLRDAEKVLREFRSGCAWIPREAYRRVDRISNELDQLKKELSVKEWGR